MIHYFRKIGIGAAGLILLLIIFDATVYIYAQRDISRPPRFGGDWVTRGKVVEPVNTSRRQTIIFVHGFVGSPYDFYPLVDRLSDLGYRLVIPIVPGQNRSVSVYERPRYSADMYIQWLSDLVDEETSYYGTKPILVGFSMGATLATIVASKKNLEKLILIAPYFELSYFHVFLSNMARLFHWVIPALPKTSPGKISCIIPDVPYEPGSYILSVEGFYNLNIIAYLAEKAIRHVGGRILFLHSTNDTVASFEAAKRVLLGHQNVESVVFDKSNHVLLFDCDSQIAISHISKFLE